MIKELREKLAPKNQIVKFWQEGKLSDTEFAKAMANERERQKEVTREWDEEREKELCSADLMQDENEVVSMTEVIADQEFRWAEEHGAYQDANGDWQV